MEDSTFSNGEAVLGGGNPTALLFPQSTGSGRDPRRDSGVTLLSLLQDLGELLTVEHQQGDGTAGGDLNSSKPTREELEVVGSRVASLLPSLIEEFCQKKENANANASGHHHNQQQQHAQNAKSEMEIQSICKLMKLAIMQFPSIFGRNNQVRSKAPSLLRILSRDRSF